MDKHPPHLCVAAMHTKGARQATSAGLRSMRGQNRPAVNRPSHAAGAKATADVTFVGKVVGNRRYASAQAPGEHVRWTESDAEWGQTAHNKD